MNTQSNIQSSLQLLLVCCLALICTITPLFAQEEPENKPQPGIASVLRGLNWGDGHQVVFKFLEKEIKQSFDAKIDKARDDLEIDLIRKDLKKALENLKNTYTSFTGQRTGYEVSLIKGDFKHNNSETLIRIDEKQKQRYYFFRYDKLFKLVVAYPNTIAGDAGFEGFVSKIEEKYGSPVKVDWDTPQGGTRTMVRGIWQDEKTQLIVEDFSSFYSRFTTKFVSVEQGLEIEELHEKGTVKNGTKNAKSSASVNIYGEDTDQGENVIDQITGVKHSVNLQRISKEERMAVKQAMKQEEMTEEEEKGKKKKKSKKSAEETSPKEKEKPKKLDIKMDGEVY
jgi:hypothetical protein